MSVNNMGNTYFRAVPPSEELCKPEDSKSLFVLDCGCFWFKIGSNKGNLSVCTDFFEKYLRSEKRIMIDDGIFETTGIFLEKGQGFFEINSTEILAWVLVEENGKIILKGKYFAADADSDEYGPVCLTGIYLSNEFSKVVKKDSDIIFVNEHTIFYVNDNGDKCLFSIDRSVKDELKLNNIGDFCPMEGNSFYLNEIEVQENNKLELTIGGKYGTPIKISTTIISEVHGSKCINFSSIVTMEFKDDNGVTQQITYDFIDNENDNPFLGLSYNELLSRVSDYIEKHNSNCQAFNRHKVLCQ